MAFITTIKPQVELLFNPELVGFADFLGEYQPMVSELGIYIKARLSDLRQTQGWLAEQVDVSNNAVTKWIKTGQISREKLFAVIGVLGSKDAPPYLESVISGESRRIDMTGVKVSDIGPVALECARVINSLPTKSQQKLLHFLQGVTEFKSNGTFSSEELPLLQISDDNDH